MNLKMTLFACLAMGMIGQSCAAALIAYEGFDYPNDGPGIAGRTGGSGWNGAWIDTAPDFEHLTQDDTSLSSPAFPYTAIGDRVAGTGGSSARDFNGSINLANDGEVLYASFLFQKVADGGTSGDNVEFDFGNTSSNQIVRFGSASGTDYFMRLGSASAPGVGVVPIGETQFVVLKLSSSATSDDSFEALIFGPTETVPAVEPSSWDLTASSDRSDTLTRVRIAFGNNASGALDEFRVGTSWESVAGIPEPSSMTIVVMSISATLAFRRRL